MPQSLAHVALLVRDYDEAIGWFTTRLGFTLVEDIYQPEQDKRWVVVAPPGAAAGGASLLLARAATPEQEKFVGNQAGGRVFLFLATDDFGRDHAKMAAAGVRFVREPKQAPYGTVAVFEDLYGNLWDLVQLTASGDTAERRTDSATRLIHATPEAIHHAFVDADALMAWLPPEGMSGRILLFEPKEGGRYRIELSYKDAAPSGAGKTSARSDISCGTFLALDPGRRIVQTAMFESGDPAFAGEMIITWSMRDTDEGTEVIVTASNVPPGIKQQDHEAGLASSLDNLARFVEAARDDETEPRIGLFSYGTLRQENVQRATFGRLLDGRPDALAGYALSPMPIDDPEVVATSGLAVHTIARPTGNPADRIHGMLFEVTPAELEAADRYEVDGIVRISVRLASGAEAFVYVAAES